MESKKKLMELEGVKRIVPLDAALRIDNLPFKITRRMMCEIAFWAQDQSSYKAASKVIKKVHGVNLSIGTIRTVTDYVGKMIFEKDESRANKDYHSRHSNSEIRVKEKKSEAFYTQTDGASVNTRTKNKEGTTWKENKLGLVFSSDDIKITINNKGEKRSEILKKEYVSYIGSSKEFKKHLYSCALRNGYKEHKVVVIIGDGASWIWTISNEMFPNAIQILDLFHLSENVYKYAKEIFGSNQKKYDPWAKRIIQKLKSGLKDEVLQEITALTREKNPEFKLCRYIRNNYNRIDYPEYIEKGFYIGSGAIESGNKSVMQKRLKLAGMRWGEKSAQYLLSLRAKFESNLWQSEVVDYVMEYDFKNLENL